MKKTVEIIHPITRRAMEHSVSLTRGTVEGIGNQARLETIRRLMEIKNEQT